MKENKKTEIKVGATVFFAIIIFAIIYGWSKNYSLNSESHNLFVNFPTVAGLEIGDLVSVNGVRKGLIKSIKSGSNSALVELKFNEEVDLRKDATFSIMMLDLMGGKKVEISSGTSSLKLDYSQIQNGKFSGDISTAMAALSSVEGDLFELISELKKSLFNVNKLFDDKNFISNVNSSITNLEKLSNNLNSIIVENKDALNSSIKNLESLTEKTNLFFNENNETIKSSFTNLDSTLVLAENLLVKLNSLSDQIVNKENNIGKLVYDEKLIIDLKESFKQIKELTSTINKQLKSGGLEVKADVDLF